jgi:hypothetical protein
LVLVVQVVSKVTELRALAQPLDLLAQLVADLVHGVITQEALVVVLAVLVVVAALVVEAHLLELEQLIKGLLVVLVAITLLHIVLEVAVVLVELD